MKTALFVDFDNIYTSLTRYDWQAARVFADSPAKWLSWLEMAAPLAPRSILVRRCYLNPVRHWTHRAFFVHSGFQVVDCPPYTRGAKNGADIQMVMDVLDILQHSTRFDEFILLSGDSDFTPLLLRLRAHDRLTTILTLEFAASAYRSACDVVLDEDDFVEQALLAEEILPRDSDVRPSGQVERAGVRYAAAPADIPLASMIPDAVMSNDDSLRTEAVQIIEQILALSDRPIASATVTSRLRQHFGERLSKTWNGTGGFKEFVLSLPQSSFRVSWSVPGYFYDPQRHEVPAIHQQGLGETLTTDTKLNELAQRIHDLTDVPLLTPEEFRIVFEAIGNEANARGSSSITEISKAVRDACLAQKAQVARQQVSWILKGIYYSGYSLANNQGSIEPVALSRAFYQNVKNLCERAQLALDENDLAMVDRWIRGDFEQLEPEPDLGLDTGEDV